jgi:hypothetical protein
LGLLTFYKQKITDGNEWMALRSISYFEDADRQPMPGMYHDISWDAIKGHIEAAVRECAGL